MLTLSAGVSTVNHQHFTELMVSQLDGSISAQDRQRLMDHLASCDHCHATWERLQKVDRQFKAGIVVTPSVRFAQKLEDSIASLPARHSRTGLSQDQQLGLLVAPILILCTSLLMAISSLWQQPSLIAHLLFVQLPRLVSVTNRILDSAIMQHWSLSLRAWQDQLHGLMQISAWQTILIGYLGTTFLLGLAGLYLLDRMNRHPRALASRSS